MINVIQAIIDDCNNSDKICRNFSTKKGARFVASIETSMDSAFEWYQEELKCRKWLTDKTLEAKRNEMRHLVDQMEDAFANLHKAEWAQGEAFCEYLNCENKFDEMEKYGLDDYSQLWEHQDEIQKDLPGEMEDYFHYRMKNGI